MRLLPFVLILLLNGCWQGLIAPASEPVPLPAKREFRRGNLVIHNDADVSENHPLFVELARFPEQVCQSLQLPVSDKLIHIYLFADRLAFERYILESFKDIPGRRALFVKRPPIAISKESELQVLCFWGDRIQNDLRHELTHATLHSVLHEVPLWLDEGLAMYFESGIAAAGKNLRAMEALATGSVKFDLARLQRLTQVSEMGLGDYHEAWAWTHYLLHGSPLQRSATLQYLRDMMKAGKIATPVAEETELQDHLKMLLSERSSWPGW
jgi:hypothetical protein